MQNISTFNETDVREELLAPLVRSLGYAKGTNNDIQREPTLRYPIYQQLGRPSKNDKPITGRPDYICEVRGAGRWVLEAKGATEELNELVKYQAFSYANHHYVAAIFFVLSNGNRIQVFRTSGGPHSAPILDIELHGNIYAEDELKKYLSPSAIQTFSLAEACQTISASLGNIDVISGEAVFENSVYKLDVPSHIRTFIEPQIKDRNQQLIGTIYPLKSGSIVFENDQVIVDIELGAPSLSDLEMQRHLGIDRIRFQTLGERISENPNDPTILQSISTIVAKAGEKLNSTRFPEDDTVPPTDLPMNVQVDALVYKSNSEILGKFFYTVSAEIPQLPGSNVQIQLFGSLLLNCK